MYTDYEAGREREGMHITNAASQFQLLLVAKLSIPKPEIHLVAITASKDRLVLLIDNKVSIWIGSDYMTFKRFAFRLTAPVCMIDKSIILNWKIKAGSIRCGHETQLCHMMKLGETSLILIMKLFVTC